MTKTALVTGISGFTGPYIAAELLARGYEVHGLGREESKLSNVQSHQVDLGDLDRLKSLLSKVQPDAVLHLAAIAFVGHTDFSDLYLSNIVGTRNLLEAIDSTGIDVEQILLASSANIYGNTDVGILDESQPYRPANDYAVSKCSMEMMAHLWTDRLPITIARPFNYTGKGQSPNFLVPKIVGHFQRQEPVIELGNVDVYRDFSDVRMVADSYARLLDSGIPGGTFNICSGTEHSLQYILDTLGALAGYDIEVQVNPSFVRASEIKHLRGANQKLETAIGALKIIPLEDTLRWMYEG